MVNPTNPTSLVPSVNFPLESQTMDPQNNEHLVLDSPEKCAEEIDKGSQTNFSEYNTAKILELLNSNLPPAHIARVLKPIVITRGPSFWKLLLEIFRSNPEKYREHFFWMLRSELSATILPEDRLEAENLLGEWAHTLVTDPIERALDLSFSDTTLYQIIWWGQHFTSLQQDKLLLAISEIADSDKKATAWYFVLTFGNLPLEKIPDIKLNDIPKEHRYRKILEGFVFLYNYDKKIAKGVLQTAAKLMELTKFYPNNSLTLYINAKLPTLTNSELNTLPAVLPTAIRCFSILYRLNFAIESKDPNYLLCLCHFEGIFQYVPLSALETLFPNCDCFIGFKNHDLDAIYNGIKQMHQKIDNWTNEEDPYLFSRMLHHYLLYLELYSYSIPELKASLASFFSQERIIIYQNNHQNFDHHDIQRICLETAWHNLVERQLGAGSGATFSFFCCSLSNHPKQWNIKDNTNQMAALILDSLQNRSHVLVGTRPDLSHFVQTEAFLLFVITNQRFDDYFDLWLKFHNKLAMNSGFTNVIGAWLVTSPNEASQNKALTIIDEFPDISMFLLAFRVKYPSAITLKIIAAILARNCLTAEELKHWIALLVDPQNKGGDKKFWSLIRSLMQNAVVDLKDDFSEVWKKIEERKAIAETPEVKIRPSKIAKTVLRYGAAGWTKITEMVRQQQTAKISKAVILVRSWTGMIEPQGNNRFVLDDLKVPEKPHKDPSTFKLTKQISVLQKYGRISASPIVKAVVESYNYDSFSEVNVLILLQRLLSTDSDETLLSDLENIKKHLPLEVYPAHSMPVNYVIQICALIDLVLQNKDSDSIAQVANRGKLITLAVVNIVRDQLSPEQLLSVIQHSDHEFVMRHVSWAISKNYSKWDKQSKDVQLLLKAALLKDKLMFQLDRQIVAEFCGLEDIVEMSPAYMLECCSLYIAQLRKADCTNVEDLLLALARLHRHLEAEPQRQKIFDHDVWMMIALRLSTFAYKTEGRPQNPVLAYWFGHKKDIDLDRHFLLTALSLTCLHIGEEFIHTEYGCIAILKDFGKNAAWYPSRLETIFKVLTKPGFVKMLFEQNFEFPEFCGPELAKCSLFDSAAEIYLTYFEKDARMKTWLKQFIFNLLQHSKSKISKDRFEKLIESVKQYEWNIISKLKYVNSSYRLYAILKAYSSLPETFAEANRQQLLEWMDLYLAKCDATDAAEVTLARDLFLDLKKIIKKKPPAVDKSKKRKTKKDNYEALFKERENKFNQKITVLATSKEAINRDILLKHDEMMTKLRDQQELHKNKVAELKKSLSLQTTLTQLEQYQEEFNARFIEFVEGHQNNFNTDLKNSKGIKKIQATDAWISKTQEDLEQLLKSEIEKISTIEKEHEACLDALKKMEALKQRKLELKKQNQFPTVHEAYLKAMEEHNAARAKLEEQYLGESGLLEEYEIKLAELETLYHLKMISIGRSATPARQPVQDIRTARLEKQNEKLKETVSVLKVENKTLKTTVEQQSAEMRRLKYRQYSPEVLAQKQKKVKDRLIDNLKTLIESNRHIKEAAPILKMIDCEGKILIAIADRKKILDLANYTHLNTAGSHRTYGGQFGERITLSKHDKEKPEPEILDILHKLHHTSQKWLTN